MTPRRWRRPLPKRGSTRPLRKSSWWTVAERSKRYGWRPSRSTSTGPMATGRRSSWSWATANTPTGTGTQPSRSTVCPVLILRQRSWRRGPGAAAVDVLLGGVHGRGAGQAQGSGPQAPARSRVTVRLGAHICTGAGIGVGRRRTIDRHDTGTQFSFPTPRRQASTLA